MGSRNRAALLLLISVPIISWSGISFAYRPFDSTDAAVADVGQLEVELGPVGFRRTDAERTVIAPKYVLNYGFAKNWELVLEGRAEHPVTPAEDDNRSRFVDDAVSLKGVLHEGVLQGKTGPSIATEFGVLLPGVNAEHGTGASLAGIVSQRWDWGTVHFNTAVALTREHHADYFVGVILEGPHDWPVRPVAEILYDRDVGQFHTRSALVGAIWQVQDNIAVDFGLRGARVNNRTAGEIRAGVTFAFGVTKGPEILSHITATALHGSR